MRQRPSFFLTSYSYRMVPAYAVRVAALLDERLYLQPSSSLGRRCRIRLRSLVTEDGLGQPGTITSCSRATLASAAASFKMGSRIPSGTIPSTAGFLLALWVPGCRRRND